MGRRSAGPFLFFRGKASLQTPRCPSPQPSPRKREREHHSPSEVVGARLARDLASIVQGAPGKSAGRERSKLPYRPLSPPPPPPGASHPFFHHFPFFCLS